MPPMPGFLALDQGALVLVYGLTTWLFFGQFARTRSVPLLFLAAGSLYTTIIALVQILCFPDMLSLGLIMGQGAVTLTWMWSFWHLGPPLFALAYAILMGRRRAWLTPPDRMSIVTWGTVAAIGVAGALSTLVATRYSAFLPIVMDANGGYWALTTSGVGPALAALTVLALAVLWWTTRLRSVLELWLAVSLFLLFLDNFLTDLGAARATMGWFMGRVAGLLAALVMFSVYLREANALRRRADETAISQEMAWSQAQSARENLDIVLDASGMGDWELDLHTDTSHRTLRHDRLFGYTELQAEWGSARMLDHVVPEDKAMVSAEFKRAVRDGKLEIECRIRRAGDGAVRWIAIYGRTSYDAAGNPHGMAGCVLDVTERRQTAERLLQSERLEAIGQLTGGVAHDFNNLLTVILGSLDLISRRPDDAARVERLARNALAAGRRGTDLTEKLLTFSRRQIINLETVNLNHLLFDFRPLIQRTVGEQVVVEFDLDPRLHLGQLDQGQVQAAILNLAGNARDAMPNGGRFRIETRNLRLGTAEAAGLPDAIAGDYFGVILSDTGTGMDPATIARAFEPFFTTKEIGKGTGLGLSQVYGFVRQAGGHCRVRSAPGQGCVVELYFPRSVAAPSTPAASLHVLPLQRAANSEVVLIVEDEPSVLELAAISLTELGYSVLTAPDARVALDMLRGPSRVDILFSDVIMPGGMNGAQLAVEARVVRPDLRVLLTSGYTVTATGGARDLPEGVPMLRKPYLRENLAEKLRSL